MHGEWLGNLSPIKRSTDVLWIDQCSFACVGNHVPFHMAWFTLEAPTAMTRWQAWGARQVHDSMVTVCLWKSCGRCWRQHVVPVSGGIKMAAHLAQTIWPAACILRGENSEVDSHNVSHCMVDLECPKPKRSMVSLYRKILEKSLANHSLLATMGSRFRNSMLELSRTASTSSTGKRSFFFFRVANRSELLGIVIEEQEFGLKMIEEAITFKMIIFYIMGLNSKL